MRLRVLRGISVLAGGDGFDVDRSLDADCCFSRLSNSSLHPDCDPCCIDHAAERCPGPAVAGIALFTATLAAEFAVPFV